MHVIHITTWFFEYTVELANGLSKIDDITVTLILPETTRKYLGDTWSKLLNPHINVKLFSYGRVKSARNILMAPFTIYFLIRYINRMRPDVIHIQESPGVFVCLALPFIKRYPIVSTNHDVKPHLGFEKGFKSSYREILRKIVTRYSNKIIVHGEYLKNVAISYLHLKAGDVYVIPHGEFSIFKKWNEEINTNEEQNTILFFGRIGKYKGLDYLIKAEPLISRIIPELKFIIAGSGDYFQECEKMMLNKERFECHIRFIPNEEVPELFQRASIVVLPYIDASQSGIIPIAYAFKKPVVVTNVGSIPEVVDDGKTGFIVPPRDTKALANAIIKLLKDDELRKQMGENAYKKMKEDLSWDKIAEKTIEVYKEVIADAN
jgi:glycosyltransferase involved in cell wall biosynthesis